MLHERDATLKWIIAVGWNAMAQTNDHINCSKCYLSDWWIAHPTLLDITYYLRSTRKLN